MNGSNRRMRVVFGVCAFLVLVAVGGPRVLSLYYQEQGGQLLDQVLEAKGLEEAEDLWLVPISIDEPALLAQVKEAQECFDQAIASNPKNAQAYRWRGRTAFLQRRSDQAVEAFSTYVQLRPKDPLGYWSLGMAYEQVAEQVRRSASWSLDLGLVAPTEDLSLLQVTGHMTASLADACIDTPDVRIETPYCDPAEGPSSCFVARDTWEMPLALVQGAMVFTDPVRSEVVFMHPPSQATWQLRLPAAPSTLIFWMGLDPDAQEWWGDGVTFRVFLNDGEVFSHHLTADEACQGWRAGWVDLEDWVGKPISLTLRTDAGAEGDGAGDWSGWGKVQVVPSVLASYAVSEPELAMVHAWKQGGFEAPQFVAAGNSVLRQGRQEEAVLWFTRAARLSPTWEEPWRLLDDIE